MIGYMWADGVIREDQDESVALNNGSGTDWVILRGTAVSIWNLLADPQTTEAISARLIATYRGAPDDIRRDVDEVVARLLEKKLIAPAP